MSRRRALESSARIEYLSGMSESAAPPRALRVFVNGRGVDAPPGATALHAVHAADDAEASAITAGHRAITDSRGLPVDPWSPAYAGAIYRTVRARPATA